VTSDIKNLRCLGKGVNGDETAVEEKGGAIFLDKGERPWKEGFVHPAHVEGGALYLSDPEQLGSRVSFRTLLE
jgi:hypothetical protein